MTKTGWISLTDDKINHDTDQTYSPTGLSTTDPEYLIIETPQSGFT